MLLSFLQRPLLSAALLAVSLLAAPAHAIVLPIGVAQLASIEGVTEYQLDNGLRVLLAPDDSKPAITVNMTYLVGSRNEGYGQTGMAHLLEHMLFKGTPTLKNAMGEFSRRGLRANGSTSADRTNYFASFAASQETLAWYLGWQADAMVNSLISREDLASEMTVVRNEMESGENNPFRMLTQKMQATAFQWHNYGKNTIGSRSDVENVDVDQLRAFYRQYYQPDNAVLIVAGKFDPQAALAAIQATLGKVPRPERVLPPQYTVEPPQDGERAITLRRAGGTPLVAAMYHIPAAGSPDYIPFDLAASILADTPSGRIYHALVTQKLAASVFGFTMDLRDPGMAMFGAQLQEGMDPDAALSALTGTLESLKERPFTQEELDRARNKWLIAWQQAYSDPQRLGMALSEAAAQGDWRLFFLMRDRVREARLDEVQRVAVAYLLPSNRTAGRYLPTAQPERAPLQTRPDLSQVLQNYQGNPDFKSAAAFDPSPASIDLATARRTLDLPGGPVQLALLPKATRGERVYAELLLQSGDAASLRGRRAVSDAVAELLMRGTPRLSRQAIEDRLDQLHADVSVDGGGTDLSITLSTTREHLPDLVALILEVIRTADFPEAEVAQYKRQALASLQSAMTEPAALASRALARHDNPWPADDPRYTPSFEESMADLQGLTREQLLGFRDTFYGTGRIFFSAVGDFDPAPVEAALRQGLEGWKRAPAYARLDDPYHEVPSARFDIATPDKANAVYMARLPLRLQDSDADFPALYLANFLLGQSETSRLWARVREKEGLSYNVRSSLSASSFEPSGSWTIYAIHAPQNRARLEAALSEELARLLQEGYTDAEVAEGVQALLNYRKLSRAQDPVLASVWIDYMQTGRSFAWSAEIDEKLKALTAGTVNAALRKYLKPEDFSVAVAGDFAKTAP